MKIIVCIGSSCHLKGSRLVVEELRQLIDRHQLGESVKLQGAFCMGDCVNGICVRLDEERFSLRPGQTEAFFEREVLPRL